MNNNIYDTDSYEMYEEQFNPLRHDRQARRKRKPKAKHTPKKAQHEIVNEVVDDTIGLEGGFQTTYTPARYEEGWLLESIRTFYDQALITDVLAQVKGGKEANVYRCAAHESVGTPMLAAKVYRPRMFRNLRNDKMYREGRVTLNDDGKEIDPKDRRLHRAIGKGTSLGQQVVHTSWLMYEFTTLQTLYDAGANVPRPYATSGNAVLMDYIGDEHLAAPTLNEVRLDPAEAPRLFEQVMRNILIMLQQNRIHGDLSAYNILYWQGDIVLIDFPQVTNTQGNSNARNILERDIVRVCDYFARYGVNSDAGAITEKLWHEFAAIDPNNLAADLSVLLEIEPEDDEDWE